MKLDCTYVQELLSAFEKKELEQDLYEEVCQHVDTCNDCSLLLEKYRTLSQLTLSFQNVDSQPSFSSEEMFREPPQEMLKEIRLNIEKEEALATVDNEVLTFREVAAFLRISEDDLEKDVSNLPFFEIGGRLRIRRSCLLQWVQEQEKKRKGYSLLSLVGNG